jgi:hypothetical protein
MIRLPLISIVPAQHSPTPPLEPPVLGTGCAAVAMGIYYCLLASQENTAFFIARYSAGQDDDYHRILRQGGTWTTAGIWEGVGAALTAGALLLQQRK